MLVKKEQEIKQLFLVKAVHPSRDHVVIPNRKDERYINSIKDNAVSGLEAILFDNEKAAQSFIEDLNTSIPHYVYPLGCINFKRIVSLKEYRVTTKTNSFKCYLVDEYKFSNY